MNRLSSIPLCPRATSISIDVLIGTFPYLGFSSHVLVKEFLYVIGLPTRLLAGIFAWLLKVVAKFASPCSDHLLKITVVALAILLGACFRDGLGT